jgi:ribose transport system permease protein
MEQASVVTGDKISEDSPAESHSAPPSGTRDSAKPVRRRRVALLGQRLARGSLLTALVLSLVLFGMARPDTFLTADNMRSILLQAAAPLVLAAGLTVLSVMRDFDLSLGAMLGLGGASAVALMSLHGVPWVLAIALALLLATVVGLVNGFITAYLGASSFITTLAMGTILVGVEFMFTGQQTIYQGVADGYLRLGQSAPVWDINIQIWIALVVAGLVWILLDRTELGRYLYAIGGNPEAARFSGIQVRKLRVLGFVIVAIAATVAGILITAQAGSSSPQAGLPYLMPAYAAVFLGSTAFRAGEFNIAGTVVAAIFLQVIQTGLQMLALPTSYINVVQGAILISAMLLSRLERAKA